MESLSSERKSIALDILEDVLSAIDRLEERTKDICIKGMRDIIAHHYFDVDASQILWIIKNEIAPLKEAIRFFIGELKR